MADIFKPFNTSTDVILSVKEVTSATCWDDPDGIMTTFHYSTTEWAYSSSNYYINVYQNADEAVSGSDPHFAIAYGNVLGSGSVTGLDALYTGLLTSSRTPSKAVYSQYRNILLQPSDTHFTFGTTQSQDIWVINFNRNKYKEKLDPGNWQLAIGGTTLIDDSGAGEDPDISASGRVFRIREGTIANGVNTASSTIFGLTYPDVGILVFSPDALNTIGVTPDRSPAVSRASFSSTNIGILFDAIDTGGSFQARTEENITSNYYFVRVGHNEFNYSNNPSFVTGSQGLIRYSLFQRDPRVYITAVGLYDNDNNLLAVAKLSKPLLKSFTREALIRVKIDF